VREQSFKGLFQSLFQSGRSKASVTAPSVKTQDKLDRTDSFKYESSRDTKRFTSLLLQTRHGILRAPSRTPELPSDAKQSPELPRAPGAAAGGQPAGRPGDRVVPTVAPIPIPPTAALRGWALLCPKITGTNPLGSSP